MSDSADGYGLLLGAFGVGAIAGAFALMDYTRRRPDERYAALAETLGSEPNVTTPTDAPGAEQRFGSAALKVNNKIFAMLVRGKLVVKLPRLRVDALIASGDGERFDPGHGRLMREWVVIEPTSDEDWLHLAREAMVFVASKR